MKFFWILASLAVDIVMLLILPFGSAVGVVLLGLVVGIIMLYDCRANTTCAFTFGLYSSMFDILVVASVLVWYILKTT